MKDNLEQRTITCRKVGTNEVTEFRIHYVTRSDNVSVTYPYYANVSLILSCRDIDVVAVWQYTEPDWHGFEVH